MKSCWGCDAQLTEHWNLAPLGADAAGNRVYEDDVYLCDDCYDGWCTKMDIQPLPSSDLA